MTTDEMLAGYAFAVVAATFICVITAILRELKTNGYVANGRSVRTVSNWEKTMKEFGEHLLKLNKRYSVTVCKVISYHVEEHK